MRGPVRRLGRRPSPGWWVLLLAHTSFHGSPIPAVESSSPVSPSHVREGRRYTLTRSAKLSV